MEIFNIRKVKVVTKNNMRYAGIAYDDVVNGEGLGAVFFAQYCPHHCKQCHNPSTWSKSGGKELTTDVVDSLMQYYNIVPFANRLTVSGGEPLAEINLKMTKYIVNRFKQLREINIIFIVIHIVYYRH